MTASVSASQSARYGRSASERFWAKVIKHPGNGCWEWIAGKSYGYGSFAVGRKCDGTRRRVAAHRFAYEELVGPIPDGLEPDHLCRNPACVRPDHLELVTHQENVRRGMSGASTRKRFAAITHCPQGHPYSGDNLYIGPDNKRDCRECRRIYTRRYYARKRVA